MSNPFFFFQSKERFKLFLKITLIAIPIFTIAILVVNYLEKGQGIEGTQNEKGGLNYYYREDSGLETLPTEVGKVINIYPNSEVTYINMGTDKQGRLSGNLYAFSKDSISKIITFYKQFPITIIDESPTKLMFKKEGIEIWVEQETILEDDPITDHEKYSIFIPEHKKADS